MEELLAKYVEAFDDGFPMFQIGRGKSDEEIRKIILRCLKENKDAYELGYVSDDLDVMY